MTQPRYWSAQLRSPVRFADGLATLADGGRAGKDLALLEVGPGNTLATFAAETAPGLPRLASLPGPRESRTDTEVMLDSLGRLWTRGAPVDWEGFHRTERRARVSLPTYPFERRVYWVGPRPAASAEAPRHEPRDTSGWFHRPEWREAPAGGAGRCGACGTADPRIRRGAWPRSRRVRSNPCRGGRPRRGPAGQRIRARERDGVRPRPGERRRLPAASPPPCARAEDRLAGVVDCWSAAPPGDTDLDGRRVVTLLSPMRLAHALSSQPTVRPLPVLLVARGSTTRAGRRPARPAAGSRRRGREGPAPGAPRPSRRARRRRRTGRAWPSSCVGELAVGRAGAGGRAARRPALRRGLRAGADRIRRAATGPAGASRRLRHRRPRAHGAQPVRGAVRPAGRAAGARRPHDRPRRPSNGPARARTPPRRPSCATSSVASRACARSGDDVLVLKADAERRACGAQRRRRAIERFGGVDMVVHGAARIDAPRSLRRPTRDRMSSTRSSPRSCAACSAWSRPSAAASPAAGVLHSSISSVLGGLGLGAYSAANAVLDAMAVAGGPSWLSVGWDLWDNAAEAHAAGMPVADPPAGGPRRVSCACWAPTSARASSSSSRTSRGAWTPGCATERPRPRGRAACDRHPRPNLSTAFVEPRTDTERELADIWGDAAGDRIRRHPRPFLRPRRPLAARGAGRAGDPRPLPDRAAGAQALPGADGGRAGRARRSGPCRGPEGRRAGWPPGDVGRVAALAAPRPRSRARRRPPRRRRATASSTTA